MNLKSSYIFQCQSFEQLLEHNKNRQHIISTLDLFVKLQFFQSPIMAAKLPLPKTILTYGTYADGQTMLKFLINGEITIDGKTHKVLPQEWGLVVIFYNYLKNLPTDWDSNDLHRAIQLRIEEKMEACDKQVKKLPEFQKNIFTSIFQRNLTPEVKELAVSMIERENQNLKNLSPSHWANQIQNKVFIIHGANDSMVPFTESI